MKIRTRLLLFLLPTLIGSIALVSALLIMGLRAAEMNIFLILCSASIIILTMVATLFIIANKISKPIQKLNHAATALAAGQYGESITSDGPKEIVELATTLNIMSECLLENINRLKENALLRERMYGEYECSMLLQHLMLQKNIDDCRSDAVAIKAITFFSETPRGLLLYFPKSHHPHLFQIHLTEALEEGLEGMYQLLTEHKANKDAARAHILLDGQNSTLSSKGPFTPFLWSLTKKQFLGQAATPANIESGDFFFLFNQGLSKFYQNPRKISDLLSKVLKVFAQDGLDTTAAMIQKELSFMIKRKELAEDIHLLCFQILWPLD